MTHHPSSGMVYVVLRWHGAAVSRHARLWGYRFRWVRLRSTQLTPGGQTRWHLDRRRHCNGQPKQRTSPRGYIQLLASANLRFGASKFFLMQIRALACWHLSVTRWEREIKKNKQTKNSLSGFVKLTLDPFGHAAYWLADTQRAACLSPLAKPDQVSCQASHSVGLHAPNVINVIWRVKSLRKASPFITLSPSSMTFCYFHSTAAVTKKRRKREACLGPSHQDHKVRCSTLSSIWKSQSVICQF